MCVCDVITHATRACCAILLALCKLLYWWVNKIWSPLWFGVVYCAVMVAILRCPWISYAFFKYVQCECMIAWFKPFLIIKTLLHYMRPFCLWSVDQTVKISRLWWMQIPCWTTYNLGVTTVGECGLDCWRITWGPAQIILMKKIVTF